MRKLSLALRQDLQNSQDSRKEVLIRLILSILSKSGRRILEANCARLVPKHARRTKKSVWPFTDQTEPEYSPPISGKLDKQAARSSGVQTQCENSRWAPGEPQRAECKPPAVGPHRSPRAAPHRRLARSTPPRVALGQPLAPVPVHKPPVARNRSSSDKPALVQKLSPTRRRLRRR